MKSDLVQADSVPAGSLPAGSLPAGSVQTGSVQTGSVQTGSVQSGVPSERAPQDEGAAPRLDGLTPPARRTELVRYVEEHKIAKVDELAERFRVSAMTVHRDLDSLVRDGVVERIRGGARAIPRRFSERDVSLRRGTLTALKRALAERASGFIEEGHIVAFDDSTTVGAVHPYVAARHPSAVITHSLGLLHRLSEDHPAFTLVGLGGQYYPETDSFLGAVVVDQISRVSADIVFVSTTSLKNNALFHPDAEAARTKRAMIGIADRKVLLVDSTKFEVNGLYHVVDLEVFDDVVVDADLAAEHRTLLDQLDLTVHYVASPHSPVPPV